MEDPSRRNTEPSSEGHFPTLEGASGWLNSPPLTPTNLLGKVVLIQFCTYTCINWLRTLPHIRAWAEKYPDLVVIGVHTPEFSFERDVDSVRRALGDMGVAHPIALDNDYGVWGAFGNQYWPALYFVDARGQIRHHRFGEGAYERSETVIQDLLSEAGVSDVGTGLVSVDAVGPEAAADWDELRSPETYLGYGRTWGFASPGGMRPEERHVYIGGERLDLNRWSMTGDWAARAEGVLLHEPNGRIEIGFHARDVHLVMGPADLGTSIPFRVTIDGEPPRNAYGSDVDGSGSGVLVQRRMYQLIRQRGAVDDRIFAIEFLDRAAEAFVFTFG
jgi:thiol-disulfide isomerase/thioredoxin